MDPNDLYILMNELVAAIHALAGYPVPASLPSVQLAPLAQMQAIVCRGPCGVRGFYTPERGVFINESLDIKRNVVARSVLLHELVHYVQHVSGKFDGLHGDCYRWFMREREAYDIQNAYLRDNRESTRFHFESVPVMCRGEDDDETN